MKFRCWAEHLLMGIAVWAGVSTVARAVEPENGIYFNPQFQGRGYVVEVQNGIVAVSVFAHDERTGRPDWFLATGRLRDDADEIPGTDPLPFAGYYPLHWMTAPLYRYSGGPCIVCGPRRDAAGNVLPLTGEKVGTLSFYSDYLRTPTIYVQPDLGQVETDLKFELVGLERTNFGYGVYGQPEGPGSHLYDQKGRWLFASKDRTRPTIDVVWNTAEVVDLGTQAGISAMSAYRAVFRDSGSAWTMTCHIGYRLLPAAVRPPVVPRSGCEFSDGGNVVFSALQDDIGLDEIAGFLGPLPAADAETLRGPLTFRGHRVE